MRENITSGKQRNRTCEGHVWLRGGVSCDWWWRVLWLVACPVIGGVSCDWWRVLTWEMLGWFNKGWMFSVTRSAQADVSAVAMMRMIRDLHLDQWTTAPWCWSATAGTVSHRVTLQPHCEAARQSGYFHCCVCFVFVCFVLNTCLVLRRHECRKCGSVSSGWISNRWCKRLAGGQTRCKPAAWRERPHNTREGGNTSQTGIPGILS